MSIVTALFLLAVTIQMGYALYFFGHIFRDFSTEKVSKEQYRAVSVIICARNEAANLRQNLPSILSQRYEKEAGKTMYEVVVVDDASEDGTAKLLEELSAQHPNLKVVTILPGMERDVPGKKYAVARGVAAAANELLLMTDADCRPASAAWLHEMVKPLLTGKQLVAGIGKFYPSGGVLNAFIRWETMHTFLQYTTYTAAGRPYMAVGRNLACTKQAFMEASKSDVWAKLPSGDDDLLMSKAADEVNTALVATPGAFTVSDAKDNWRDWIHQKQRHLSTGKYYKPSIIVLLGIYASSHALMWLAFLMLLVTANWSLALGCMTLRMLVFWATWAEATRKMEERGFFKYFLLFDIGWMIYNFAFSPYILFKDKQTWK